MKSSLALTLLFMLSPCAPAAPKIIKAHAISIHGTPKYPANYKHVEYADPGAPKGGSVVFSSVGGFDSFNSYSLKGNAAPGLRLMVDMITTNFTDDPITEYCMICETLEYPTDRSSITYHLNSKAKFQDGSDITAEDLAFSFDVVTKNLPQYKAYYADVKPPVVIDAHTIRFEFKKPNNELPVIIGQLPALSKKYWSGKDITKSTLEIPLGSGPYKIKSFEPGRSITYELNKDYWAKDLPARRGFFNIATIRIDNYGDDVALEAFKGGAFDFRGELSAKHWNVDYDSVGKTKGQFTMELVSDTSPSGMQGFIFNIRRPIFKDARVREALGLLFDFEWMNANLFYKAYNRTKSYFENSKMASHDLPKGEELKILEKYKADLPPEVFTTAFKMPSNKTDTERKANLKKALQLLEQAGWKFSGGALKNASGEPFQFEFLMAASPSMERVILAYQQSLAKAGVKMSVRTVDGAQYSNRLRDFDFDMISDVIPQSDSPGNEQRDYFGSANAQAKGSRNYIGVENKVIDQIIESMLATTTESALFDHVRALDRVLLWNYYVVPNWYLGKNRLAVWNKFGRPAKMSPRAPGVESWSYTDTWWVDAKKEAALKKDRG